MRLIWYPLEEEEFIHIYLFTHHTLLIAVLWFRSKNCRSCQKEAI